VSDLPLEDLLGGHYRLHAVRGHLFEMLGDHNTATAAYAAAARAREASPERNYLTAKAAQARQRAAATG
jgi:predicted RNA polymerase sigma factor